jgi:hypothetical protein
MDLTAQLLVALGGFRPLHAALLREPHPAADRQSGQGQGGGQEYRCRRVAPAPTPRPLGPAHRPRLDWPPFPEPPQIVGQGCRALVAPPRLLGQALQTDGVQVARHLVVQP